jgi:hypothetical protein
MFNIIALISIVISMMSPADVKPAYYQEYNLIGEIPEVVISAPRPTDNEIKSYGMMPEVVVIAERYPQTNTDIIYTHPNPAINYKQSSFKHFYLYVMIVVMAVFLFALAKIFLPVVSRPVYITIGRMQTRRRSHKR